MHSVLCRNQYLLELSNRLLHRQVLFELKGGRVDLVPLPLVKLDEVTLVVADTDLACIHIYRQSVTKPLYLVLVCKSKQLNNANFVFVIASVMYRNQNMNMLTSSLFTGRGTLMLQVVAFYCKKNARARMQRHELQTL